MIAKPKNGITRFEDCPRATELHTPAPIGYLQWHEWAERKSKTHRQERCPECGFLSIWKPKAKRPTAAIQPDRQSRTES